MNGIEFFQQGENVLYKTDDDDPKVMVKGDRWIVKLVMSLLKERYPKALACLEKEYEGLRGDAWNYEFRMVRRFVKCNFGRIDPIMDLDGVGGIHFEYVSCPLRGECRAEGVICSPEVENPLSEREREVMRLVAIEGLDAEKVAERLYISPFTVKKHMSNAYEKAGVSSEADFVRWATRWGIFDETKKNR